MTTTVKIWGTTAALVRSPLFEMHKLTIKPFHRCSKHIHEFKHNAFYVIEGTLHLDMAGRTRTLKAGEHYTIKPKIAHQFRTGAEPCVALEMYYTEALSDDIVRYNTGGPCD